ncbi:MAG: twin-arginine translocase subunit TatC [Acidobacteriota bacterium]|jgi:sec-independent protein translocase protein TatC
MTQPDPQGQMSFLQHLDELRTRLIRAVAALIVAFLLCLSIARPVYEFMVRPIEKFLPEGEKLAFTHLTDPFLLYMKVAFLTAIFLATPFILLEAWLFIAPGLYPRERRYAIPFIFFSSVFFMAGGAFGYYIVLPPAARFFIQQGVDWGFRPVLTVRELLSFESRILLGLGVVFEMPILTFFLARIGLVNGRMLLRQFKYAILVIFILAAILTPTPDMLTQSLFAAPMVFLYVLSIAVAAVFGKKREDG